ncbi:hypothetical protein [Streptomyces marianii]|uniref:Uncharacterized protein n=1 Tax=Streptomyces marianii TaxID=1817406 RepID=A0A5R9EIJ6_9ACTN|nr:hypothetical protein [Streptomyces marianii]TLQ47584.1 hypothetical protein FEF34_35725 [Streptomyces marianii]
MFQWLWTAVWSAVMLPLGAAMIAGRVPLWMRRQSTPGGLKVKGIAAFVLYAGLMVPPLTTLSGIRPEDADFVRMVLVPMTVFLGHGLILGATLCERFNRREMERAGVPAVPATSTSGMPDHRGTAR